MVAEPLAIRLMGPLEIVRAGEPVAFPRSKKTRALLGYLAITGRPHRRERLTSLLWDVADDPRGALRWCLSKLRGVLDDEGSPRVIADRESISLDLDGVAVDFNRLRDAVETGLSSRPTAELVEIADGVRGELLEGLEMADFDELQAWLAAVREDCRQLRARLLAELTARLHDDPEAALPYARERVRVEPQSAERRAELVSCLAATGRRREAAQQLDAGKRALAEAGVSDAPLRSAARALEAAPAAAEVSVTRGAPLRQEIRFCTSFDGTQIAYATVGSGPPIVKTAHWLTHLEYDWESPVWRHWYEWLATGQRVVRYDERGNGLSDWNVGQPTLEEFVRDLEAVVDAAGIERFDMLGISKGASVAIAYAVRHPERVRKIVLHGGFAKGWLVDASEERHEAEAAMRMLMRTRWGAANPGFRQLFTTYFVPGATLEQMQWFNELQRHTTSADNAIFLREAAGLIDVRELLPKVHAPVLVTHSRDDAAVPYKLGRQLAAGLPDARLVTLESRNHLLLADEPAWSEFQRQVRDFLAD